ncbi:P-loop containing nucleoside triphosphate hydrolase protein, partial [Thamnocephalis sphaerospora]
LDAVALDATQEAALRHDLAVFLAGRSVYSRMGLPYRRGYMFHGKPGTGKTTLINAIAAELRRDIYHMNLRLFKSDSSLYSAFSSVPKDQIIVLEDIDAMSKVCHRRDAPLDLLRRTFTLSALLACLDGQVVNEGNIVIMTTNHPELLDPALTRAGRIDLKLELGYATRYQIRRMY